MTVPFGLLRCSARVFLLVALVGVLVVGVAGPGLHTALAADRRLEEAQQERAAVQRRLDTVGREIERTRAAVESAREELDELRGQSERHDDVARAAERLRTMRIRESYKRGGGDLVLDLLRAEHPTDVLEHARFLAWMAQESREDAEAATASAVRSQALVDHTATVVEQLREREETLASKQAEIDALLKEAIKAEQEVAALIAKEEREAARRAAVAARASRSSRNPATSGGAAPVSGGVACPVGTPRTYVDSWGAPRSGGRRHLGTDILAPRGTVTPAYEDGVISRLSSNRLGGISLYLRGDSGNVYYYTHLSGYANVRVGQRVAAGQVMAYVGATGNAGGTNHLHFEVRPGGGGNVNPYPYVRRACG